MLKKQLRPSESTAREAYRVLGEPRLRSDQERAFYSALRDLLDDAWKPQEIWEYQDIIDFSRRRTEILRFEVAHVELLNSAPVLAEQLRIIFGEAKDLSEQTALDYCGGDAKKAKAAAELIRQKGLLICQVEASILVSQLSNLAMLDQLSRFREAANEQAMRRLCKAKKARASSQKDVREGRSPDKSAVPTSRGMPASSRNRLFVVDR